MCRFPALSSEGPKVTLALAYSYKKKGERSPSHKTTRDVDKPRKLKKLIKIAILENSIKNLLILPQGFPDLILTRTGKKYAEFDIVSEKKNIELFWGFYWPLIFRIS